VAVSYVGEGDYRALPPGPLTAEWPEGARRVAVSNQALPV